MANFSATQISREISFGKSKASEKTILTYVDEALVSQNLLDSKCHVHLFFELYQKYITKFTHLSKLWQIDHNQSTLLMSQFEKFEINSI